MCGSFWLYLLLLTYIPFLHADQILVFKRLDRLDLMTFSKFFLSLKNLVLMLFKLLGR